MVHPDKNKAPDAGKAFQALKKAFDAIMSGQNPDDPDTCFVECPDPTCGATIYINREKYNMILKGWDIGFCRVCKRKIGRVS